MYTKNCHAYLKISLKYQFSSRWISSRWLFLIRRSFSLWSNLWHFRQSLQWLKIEQFHRFKVGKNPGGSCRGGSWGFFWQILGRGVLSGCQKIWQCNSVPLSQFFVAFLNKFFKILGHALFSIFIRVSLQFKVIGIIFYIFRIDFWCIITFLLTCFSNICQWANLCPPPLPLHLHTLKYSESRLMWSLIMLSFN